MKCPHCKQMKTNNFDKFSIEKRGSCVTCFARLEELKKYNYVKDVGKENAY